MIFAPYYRRIRLTFFETLRRFPLAILCSLAFCIISIRYDKIENFSTSLATLLCGWCWFVALQLFWEGRQYHQRYSYLVAIPIFLILGNYIRFEAVLNTNIMVLVMGLFLLIFCAPFLGTSRNSQQFWLFSYRLCCRIAYAWFAALILFLGISAVLFCLEYLFSLKFYASQYKDFGIISFTFFFPIILLTGVATSFDEELESDKAKPIYYLLGYLVVPLLFTYSLILYAYIVKIAVNQSLPRGKVAYLVSSYGCVGILTYLAGIPIEASRGRLLALFRQHFFKIFIFPTILLAIGITYRLQQYGLTESRYMLVFCLIWFLLAILFSFIVRPQLLAKAIYIPLPLLFVLASFGPWSISNLPAIDQTRRLQQLLQQNHIMQKGMIVPGSHKINPADQERISSILDYLAGHKKTDTLASWLPESQAKEVFNNKEYIKPEKIAALMGVEYVRRTDRSSKDVVFNYSLERQEYLKTTGYDYCIPSICLSSYDYKSTIMTRKIYIPELKQSIVASFDKTTNTLTINKDKQVLITISLNDLVAKLRTIRDEKTIEKELIAFQQNEQISCQLIFYRLSGRITTETRQIEIEDFQFGLLIGMR